MGAPMRTAGPIKAGTCPADGSPGGASAASRLACSAACITPQSARQGKRQDKTATSRYSRWLRPDQGPIHCCSSCHCPGIATPSSRLQCDFSLAEREPSYFATSMWTHKHFMHRTCTPCSICSIQQYAGELVGFRGLPRDASGCHPSAAHLRFQVSHGSSNGGSVFRRYPLCCCHGCCRHGGRCVVRRTSRLNRIWPHWEVNPSVLRHPTTPTGHSSVT
jgi:hypothetical protein